MSYTESSQLAVRQNALPIKESYKSRPLKWLSSLHSPILNSTQNSPPNERAFNLSTAVVEPLAHTQGIKPTKQCPNGSNCQTKTSRVMEWGLFWRSNGTPTPFGLRHYRNLQWLLNAAKTHYPHICQSTMKGTRKLLLLPCIKLL